MKKVNIKLLITIFVLCKFNLLIAQNAFNDALTIRKEVTPSGLIDFTDNFSISILFTYLPPDEKNRFEAIVDNNIKRDSIVKYYRRTNPFIKISGSVQDAPPFVPSTASFLPSSIGNLDVTNIADGFAKFIVERTKQELQAAFFDKFRKEIKDDKFKDLQTLFPATFKLLEQLPEKIISYEKYINSLRDAFGKDLDGIIPHIEEVIKTGNLARFFNNHKELKSVSLTGLYFANALIKQGKHIGKAIEDFNPASTDYDFSNTDVNFIKTNALLFVKEVSASLKKANTSNNEYYVTFDSIQTMIEDPVTLDLYLGLLSQKLINLQISNANDKTYGRLMFDLKADADVLKNFISSINSNISLVQTNLSNLKEKPRAERTLDDFTTVFNSATGLIESFKNNDFIDKIKTIIPAAATDIETFWKKYEDIKETVGAAISLYGNVKQKHYCLALSDVKNLYELRYPGNQASHDSITKYVQGVGKFLIDKGTMICGVAQAKTSQEVYEAIDKVAMPVGSYRVKRFSVSNIAVQSYCGLFIGSEKKVEGEGRTSSFGMTAPIGLSFSLGGKNQNNSLSLFASIVDLGAITAFRFQNDTAKTLQKIQLKDIISPGLFISYGLGKCPLNINFGYQITPYLSFVSADENTFQSSFGRWSLSFVVDIPIFNLYTKSR